MITVFVWTYRGKNEAWGHASMQCGSDYVSWWPAAGGRALSGVSRAAESVLGSSTPQALHSVYAASPIRNRTLVDDELDEGDRERGVRRPADQRITIQGLDERAITSWWRGFSLHGGRLQGPMRPWHTTDQNCSTVVAMGLRAGGGDQFAAGRHSWNVIWTPADVTRYANSIRAGIRKAPR